MVIRHKFFIAMIFLSSLVGKRMESEYQTDNSS